MGQKTIGTAIFIVGALIGILAFMYPLLLPALAEWGFPEQASNAQTPIFTAILLLFTVAVLLLEVQGQRTSAKIVAALGVLVAATSVLRFLEVAIPGPGGFSPVFVPIIIAGYVFGSRFGFLMGTLTILVSALLTGGIGPWLPYQMFATGWVGLTAGLLPHPLRSSWQLLLLVAFSFIWGILYGFIMNIYFWPFMNAGGAAGNEAVSFGATLTSYGTFYVTTSAVWDVTRAAGNALLMLALGLPAIRALKRFRDRFQFQIAVTR